MQTNQHVSPPRRSQLTGSTVYDPRDARFIVAQDARMGDPGPTTTRNPGNVGLIVIPAFRQEDDPSQMKGT
jgi:hypothetical protein